MLSKNVFGYNTPKQKNEQTLFLADKYNSERHYSGAVALLAIQSDTVALTVCSHRVLSCCVDRPTCGLICVDV